MIIFWIKEKNLADKKFTGQESTINLSELGSGEPETSSSNQQSGMEKQHSKSAPNKSVW